MKKLFIIAALAAVAVACTDSKSINVKIDGQVEGLGTSVVVYLDGQTPIDTLSVADSKFVWQATLDEPAYVVLTSGTMPEAVGLFIDRDNCRFSFTLGAEGLPEVTGSPLNIYQIDIQRQLKDLYTEYRTPETTPERRAEIDKESDALYAKALEENKTNVFGASILKEQIYDMDPDQIMAAVAQFPEDLQKGKYLTECTQMAEQLRKCSVGARYTDIVLPDRDDKEVALSNYVGNGYVLIDFWASWCNPCMGEVPYLKAAYAKYHDKGFEIYGITRDRTKDKWIEAIDKNQMDWVHVSLIGDTVSTAREDYCVKFIPSNFLINPEGTIVARNLRGEALETKLSELFGQQ